MSNTKAGMGAAALVWLFLPQAASSDMFVLGDVTPIYPLTALPPYHVYAATAAAGQERNSVQGNQELFRRILGDPFDARVTILAGKRFPTNAAFELTAFFNHEGVVVDEVDVLDSENLTRTKLLVLGLPDFEWSASELKVFSSFLSNGGRVLVVVEPHLCAEACYESTETLFKAVGSDLRIADWKPGDAASSGNQWGLLADHEFMKGMPPVAYGATLAIEGGTPLIYETQGESMLSLDESIAR